ncbi:MAG: UDP-N-acetylglucosamine--N-acetylmuramyl-(pentapeptide) pyrophosphoryl-undecaprenol N-acetylglucosamine transferase, partial [Hyphomicrobiales bacterium]|nr:UDP-N-acetylglucosamine--N-acetylmuramyl-(pentapeptide) pyrophosphoryl-undecaprenol N-acetylglucosamine transferase [Hyphomicrobiales bacterium]MBV9754003.1 UDP-N-acetylglucosamine--N-acetylmuramyl-(pentapeptide) pyrophosphoryl-undecaprenol N-acetylglucosamine transferase [Hyphomicrobiales bacterium]
EALAEMLSEILTTPSRLTEMAALARQASIPDAAERLADLVAETAGLSTAAATSKAAN